MEKRTPTVDLKPILAQAAGGDHQAWRKIVELLAPKVFALILSRCHDPELAEEIAQMTFVRIVTRLGEYQEQGRFEPWLFRIAMNLLRDEMRRRKRQAKVMDMTGQDDQQQSSPWIQAQAAVSINRADDENPLEQLARAEQIELLRHAVSNLGEEDRQIIELRHAAGLSFAQIAQTLDKPLGTVLARGHRALKKLKKTLSQSALDGSRAER